MMKIAKALPFGSHFSARLEGANNKLVCALSTATTCVDDMGPIRGGQPGDLPQPEDSGTIQ